MGLLRGMAFGQGFGAMSGGPPRQDPIAEDSLDKAIRTYQGMGFPDSRVASLVLRSGYAVEAVQHRFPHLSLSDLAIQQNTVARVSIATHAASAPSPASPVASSPRPMSPSGPLRAVLNRLTTPQLPPARQASPEPIQAPAPSSEPQQERLSFQYVPLIQCTFPHGDPGEQTLFSRRNGRLELTLSTARPDTGLPYGVPARLLTIYCASEAKRNQSPQIDLGASVHDFLRRLEVPVTRGDRGSLRVYSNQLLRLIHCAISVDERLEDDAGRKGLDIRQTLFVDSARLWWDPHAGLDHDSHLVLSPQIFNSILTRSAPLSTRAIRALRKSPMDLDVYAWLVHRLYRRTEPSSVSWQQLFGQFGHTYGEIRFFRRFFCASLTKAMQAYPQARVQINQTGLLLLPSKPHVEPRGDLA